MTYLVSHSCPFYQCQNGSMSRSVSNNDVTRHGMLVNINPSMQEAEKGQSLSSGKTGLQFKFRASRATQRSRISKKENK